MAQRKHVRHLEILRDATIRVYVFGGRSESGAIPTRPHHLTTTRSATSASVRRGKSPGSLANGTDSRTSTLPRTVTDGLVESEAPRERSRARTGRAPGTRNHGTTGGRRSSGPGPILRPTRIR